MSLRRGYQVTLIVYMSGFMKTRPKDRYRALSGRFFLARNSKGDDIKIKRTVSPFFLLLLVYLLFIAVLSLFFARFYGLEAVLEFREIQVE